MLNFNMPNIPSNVSVHGKVYHRVGPLSDEGGGSAMQGAANWYVNDNGSAQRLLSAESMRLHAESMTTLSDFLHNNNRLVKLLEKSDPPTEHMHLRMKYDPSSDEVAVVVDPSLLRQGSELQRQVVFFYKGSGEACFANFKSYLYEPLQYPLIFGYGESGWGEDGDGGACYAIDPYSIHNTQAAFAVDCAVRTHSASNIKMLGISSLPRICKPDSTQVVLKLRRYVRQMVLCEPTLHKLGRLFNEYLCDAWLRVEEETLNYFRFHHGRNQNASSNLRFTTRNAFAAAQDAGGVSGRSFLPKSFQYGARAKHNLVEEGLALGKVADQRTHINFACLQCGG